jgi:hypothetical protein
MSDMPSHRLSEGDRVHVFWESTEREPSPNSWERQGWHTAPILQVPPRDHLAVERVAGRSGRSGFLGWRQGEGPRQLGNCQKFHRFAFLHNGIPQGVEELRHAVASDVVHDGVPPFLPRLRTLELAAEMFECPGNSSALLQEVPDRSSGPALRCSRSEVLSRMANRVKAFLGVANSLSGTSLLARSRTLLITLTPATHATGLRRIGEHRGLQADFVDSRDEAAQVVGDHLAQNLVYLTLEGLGPKASPCFRLIMEKVVSTLERRW